MSAGISEVEIAKKMEYVETLFRPAAVNRQLARWENHIVSVRFNSILGKVEPRWPPATPPTLAPRSSAGTPCCSSLMRSSAAGWTWSSRAE